MYFQIDIIPVPKPRMTQSDRWSKRDRVSKYWVYAEELRLRTGGIKFSSFVLEASFILPMPKSWSEKKKKEMEGRPHQSTPDLSNLVKAFEDALWKDDACIYQYKNVTKYWGREGKIYITVED
tara:strand:- start:546 stop:914 length:369 start_codon:yes stop_codon:yes gene_type:complete